MLTGPSKIRIALVDDHPLLRQGLAALVADQADMKLVAEASNGLEAIEQFCTHRPDVVLMDVQSVRALKAGARAYLLKSLLHRELLETIRAVHAGLKRIPPEVAAELAD